LSRIPVTESVWVIVAVTLGASEWQTDPVPGSEQGATTWRGVDVSRFRGG